MMNNSDTKSECPICCKPFPSDEIQIHVNRCIFLNAREEKIDCPAKESKRSFSVFQSNSPTGVKKPKLDVNIKKRNVPASGRKHTAVETIPTIEIKDDIVGDGEDVAVSDLNFNFVMNFKLFELMSAIVEPYVRS